MDFRLYSIEAAPEKLPVWESILDDLGHPSAHRIAHTLGVGQSTVYRWNQTGDAPRMACLALFWLTHWGRGEVDSRATNDAVLAVALARSLHDERNAIRTALHQVENDRDRLASMVERFTRLAHESAGHGSGAIAYHSRTGNPLAGSWGGGWSLAWQAVPVPPARVVGSADVGELPPELAALSRMQTAGRGSPAATPPTAHSTKSPGVERSSQPQPSSLPEVVLSLPSKAQWCQSDAIVTSPAPDSRDLLELRQAPRRCARARARGPASAPLATTPEKSASQGDALNRHPTAATKATREPPDSGNEYPKDSDAAQPARRPPLDALGAAPRSPPRSAFENLVDTLCHAPTERPAA